MQVFGSISNIFQLGFIMYLIDSILYKCLIRIQELTKNKPNCQSHYEQIISLLDYFETQTTLVEDQRLKVPLVTGM